MNLNKEFRPKLHWGNPLWSYIHSLIKNTKNEEISNTIQILKNLDKCIPCVKCIQIYSENLLDIDLINNKNNLFNWSVDLHNKVNKKFNKSEWTYEMSLEKWKNSSSSYYLWNFIHTITIIDFENNKRYIDEIINVLKNLLICFNNLSEDLNVYKFYLEKLTDLDLNKSMVLFYWSIDLHNEINRLYNKPEWSYNIALEKWANVSRHKEDISVYKGPVFSFDGPSGSFGLSGKSESFSFTTGPSGSTGPSVTLSLSTDPSVTLSLSTGPSGLS